MLTEGDKGEVLANLIQQGLIGEPTKKERRDVLLLRRERRQQFLEIADNLLETVGEEREDRETGARVRKTPSITVSSGTSSVDVHVAKYVFFEEGRISKYVGLVIGIPEERMLFCVNQDMEYWGEKLHGRTRIINHFGVTATHDEVLRGLQALEFIRDNLSQAKLN